MLENLPEDLTAAHAQGKAPWTERVKTDFHVAVFRDKYPVTDGHLLFVPQYATISVIVDAVNDAIEAGMKMVAAGECKGFNIGMNFGECAGQTVPWPHVHLIPRRIGDTPDPVGGVRRVVEGKGNYKKTPPPFVLQKRSKDDLNEGYNYRDHEAE